MSKLGREIILHTGSLVVNVLKDTVSDMVGQVKIGLENHTETVCNNLIRGNLTVPTLPSINCRRALATGVEKTVNHTIDKTDLGFFGNLVAAGLTLGAIIATESLKDRRIQSVSFAQQPNPDSAGVKATLALALKIVESAMDTFKKY